MGNYEHVHGAHDVIAHETVPQAQPFGHDVQGINDSMYIDDYNGLDFTDIALDWQSMLPNFGATWG